MSNAALGGGGGGTLQAQIVWCKGGKWLVLGGRGGLWHNWGPVKDDTKAGLVVVYCVPHAVHGSRAQQELEMFCSAAFSTTSTRLKGVQ